MSLIKCPECGKEFSEFAKECPDCGMPTYKILKETQHKVVNEDKLSEDIIKPKNKVVWYKNSYVLKLLASIVVFIILNIFLIDETSTVTFGRLILLNAIISLAIVFVTIPINKRNNIKGMLLMLPLYMFILTMFHKFIPTVNIVNADETHEERYAIHFHTRTSNGEIHFLAPFQSYIYNNSKRTLYLTSIGYGTYQFEPNKHTVIPPNYVVKGNVNEYFNEPSRSIWIRSKGKVKGTWYNYLDFKKY